MDKIKVKRLLKIVDYEYDSVVNVVADLKNVLKQYPDAKFGEHQYEYSDTISLAIFYEGEETDKEYAIRVERQQKHKTEQEIRERAEFERLSKKFG